MCTSLVAEVAVMRRSLAEGWAGAGHAGPHRLH